MGNFGDKRPFPGAAFRGCVWWPPASSRCQRSTVYPRSRRLLFQRRSFTSPRETIGSMDSLRQTITQRSWDHRNTWKEDDPKHAIWGVAGFVEMESGDLS